MLIFRHSEVGTNPSEFPTYVSILCTDFHGLALVRLWSLHENSWLSPGVLVLLSPSSGIPQITIEEWFSVSGCKYCLIGRETPPLENNRSDLMEYFKCRG